MSNFNFIESIFDYIVESILDENNLFYTELDKFPDSLRDYIVFDFKPDKSINFIHRNEVFESVSASFCVNLPKKLSAKYIAEAKACKNFYSTINQQFEDCKDKLVERFKERLSEKGTICVFSKAPKGMIIEEIERDEYHALKVHESHIDCIPSRKDDITIIFEPVKTLNEYNN